MAASVNERPQSTHNNIGSAIVDNDIVTPPMTVHVKSIIIIIIIVIIIIIIISTPPPLPAITTLTTTASRTQHNSSPQTTVRAATAQRANTQGTYRAP